jgi:hypothetical protein
MEKSYIQKINELKHQLNLHLDLNANSDGSFQLLNSLELRDKIAQLQDIAMK